MKKGAAGSLAADCLGEYGKEKVGPGPLQSLPRVCLPSILPLSASKLYHGDLTA